MRKLVIDAVYVDRRGRQFTYVGSSMAGSDFFFRDISGSVFEYNENEVQEVLGKDSINNPVMQ